jgi:hypothetical protein
MRCSDVLLTRLKVERRGQNPLNTVRRNAPLPSLVVSSRKMKLSRPFATRSNNGRRFGEFAEPIWKSRRGELSDLDFTDQGTYAGIDVRAIRFHTFGFDAAPLPIREIGIQRHVDSERTGTAALAARLVTSQRKERARTLLRVTPTKH